MASLIPGYEYDIFISYRQKDNKHDGWVTEFINQLKGELEATFKEDISIYFDENPSDGLLETHSVDKSLEGKLKCLIFIPVISQTYCDPKSYAWQNEFCAFNKLAKEDQVGRDIRLNSGNVASRILPVKIHDIDPDDKALLENELGGALRSIEFIYKEAGVNRPLRPTDDPKENLNKTHYINQVNKVANAVKEIISSLKKQSQETGETTEKVVCAKPERSKTRKTIIIAISLVVLGLIALGYFIFPRIFSSSKTVEKSIAVLPFKLRSDEPDKQYLADGMMDAINLHLSKIEDLRVIARTSVEQYRQTTKNTRTIGKELNVDYLLDGSFQKYGDEARLIVTLINVTEDSPIWADEYNEKWKDIFSVQSEIAQIIAGKLHIVVTPEEKKKIEKTPTNNPEAYISYLQGCDFWNKRTKEGLLKSIEFFSRAIKEDPEFALAYNGLADSYYILAWWGWLPRREGYALAKDYAMKALNIDKNLAEAHATLGSIWCWSDWNWKDAAKELKLATELNPNCATAHQYYSELLDITRNNKEARLQIDKALRLDPFSTGINASSALYYFNEGKLSEAMDGSNKILEINPDFIQAYIMKFEIYIRQGDDLKAAETLQQYVLSDSSTAPVAGMLKDVFSKYGKAGLLNGLIEWQKDNESAGIYVAKFYTMLGMKKEALECLRKILDVHSSEIRVAENFPDDIPRINNSPSFDSLRTEPGFQAIIDKMGLSEYSIK